MMRWLVLIFLPTLVMLASGCSDEHVSHQIQIVAGELFNEDVAVQTSLPDVVSAAMKKQAEEDATWIEILLAADAQGDARTLEVQQRIIRNGAEAVNLEFLLARQKEYYNRYIDAAGIAIVGNAVTSDKHYIEARTIALAMTAKHPELRERLVENGFYMILYKVWEGYKVPELYLYANLLGNPVVNLGACNKGASLITPTISGYCFAPVTGGGMREIKSSYPSEYTYMTTFAHEFGHAIEPEIARLDADFIEKLKLAYDTSMELGTWAGTKAATHWSEYWAEGIVFWFFDIGAGRSFENREAFAKRDPLLDELLGEWFIEFPMPGFTLN